jgi:hypothetical protein
MRGGHVSRTQEQRESLEVTFDWRNIPISLIDRCRCIVYAIALLLPTITPP